MTDPNGWPAADKPGVPGESGAYVLRRRDGFEFPAWWSGPTNHWTLRGGAMMKATAVAEIGTVLVGPMHTPAEVAEERAKVWEETADLMEAIADTQHGTSAEDILREAYTVLRARAAQEKQE